MLLLYSLYKPVKKHKPVDEKAENLPTCREEAYFQTKAFKYTTTLQYLLSILWLGGGWSRLWLNGVYVHSTPSDNVLDNDEGIMRP